MPTPISYDLLGTGSNSSSQLGLTHTTDISSFQSCSFFVPDRRGGKLRRDNPLDRGWRVRDLCSGAQHSLCLLQSDEGNQVWACGSNEYGQLGRKETQVVMGWRRLDVDELIARLETHSVHNESGNKRDRRRSQATTTTTTTSSSSYNHQKPSSSNHPNDGKIIYQPTSIACSWTTSFIVLSRHITPSPQSSQQPTTRLSDIIISFGSNDNSELGTTAPLPNLDRKIHQVELPLPLPKEDEIYVVKSIKAGQRSVCCLVDVLKRGKGGGGGGGGGGEGGGDGDGDGDRIRMNFVRQLVFGWGSSRHGQLSSSSSSWSSDSNTKLQPTPSLQNPQLSSETSLDSHPHPPSIASKRNAKTKSKYPNSISPTRIDLFPSPSYSYTKDEGDGEGEGKAVGNRELRVKSITIGVTHSVFLLNDGSIIGLGSNTKSQLSRKVFRDGIHQSQNVNVGKYKDVGCTWNGTFLVSSEETSSRRRDALISIGSNTHGQLGRGYSSRMPNVGEVDDERDPDENLEVDRGSEEDGMEVIKLVCGSEHVLVLCRSSSSAETNPPYAAAATRLKVWGWNEHGNLGLGDMIDRPSPDTIQIEDIMRGIDEVGRSDGGSLRNKCTIEDCWAGCGTSWVLIRKE